MFGCEHSYAFYYYYYYIIIIMITIICFLFILHGDVMVPLSQIIASCSLVMKFFWGRRVCVCVCVLFSHML